MDSLYLDLVTPENPSKPVRLKVSKNLALKAFLALAEKALSMEIYSLYINNIRLADMSQMSDGATVVAINCVSPNLSKYSFFKQSESLGSYNLDSVCSLKAVKVAVLGPQKVGKTSLILRFVHGFFKHNNIGTFVEAEYEKTIQVRSKDVCMAVFDTAGKLDYQQEVPSRLRALDAYLLVISVDQLGEWPKIVYCHKLIKKIVADPLVLILVTKFDLYDSKGQGFNLAIREKLTEISSYCKDQHLLTIKTSSKTNKNINRAFSIIADRFVNPDKFSADRSSNAELQLNHPFFFRMVSRLLRYKPCCSS